MKSMLKLRRDEHETNSFDAFLTGCILHVHINGRGGEVAGPMRCAQRDSRYHLADALGGNLEQMPRWGAGTV